MRKLEIALAVCSALGLLFMVVAGVAGERDRRAGAAGPAIIAPAEAEAMVRGLTANAVAVMNDEAMPPEEREQRLGRLLSDGFDVPLIGRFVIGRHWRAMDRAQRERYLAAFSGFLVRSYAGQLAAQRIDGVEVIGSRQAGERDVLVETRLRRAGAAPAGLYWRVRASSNGWRVIDVVAEGISLAVTKRQEFTTFVNASGGDITPLIARLEDGSPTAAPARLASGS